MNERIKAKHEMARIRGDRHDLRVILDDGLSTLSHPTGIGKQVLSLHRGLSEVCQCTLLDYSLLKIFPRLLRRLMYIVASNFNARVKKTDVFHYLNYYVPRGRKGPLKVTTIHDLTIFRFPESLPFWYRLYLRHALRTSVARADVIVSPSEAVRQEILEQFPICSGEKVVVCPNAVESACEEPPSASQQSPDGRRFFLFVGTLEYRKNLCFLIESFQQAKRRGRLAEESKLYLVGKPGYGYAEICKLLEDQDSVLSLGRVEDRELKQLYKACIALVFPSIYEGFGIPLVEAMAYGIPIIISNISTNLEMNTRHGGLMDVFSIGNQEELVECMARADQHSRLRRDPVNYGNLDRYCPTTVANHHLSVYTSALAERCDRRSPP